MSKLGPPIPMKGGDEYDGLTRWRRYLAKRAGRWKAVKRGYWRRVRRVLRAREENDGE